MAYRNAPIPLYMRLIYLFFRLLTWTGLSVFFRRRLVIAKEKAHFDGPAIVISNHPCTLMDPLNTGLNIRQEMFFLANYGLFKHPVSNWFFRNLFCIPVKRKEDVAEGEARDNEAAFEASFQHLEKNGVLYVAAEGVSWMNRYVRPFKTGSARIAFGAERRNHWQLGVKIIPVGISYEAPRLFRSRVTVEYGDPIDPKPWAEAYAKDPEKAVDDFTETIRTRVAALTLDSKSESGDPFVEQTEKMLRNSPSGRSAREQYAWLKTFLTHHIHNEALQKKVATYTAELQKAGLADAAFAHRTSFSTLLSNGLTALVLLPFFLLGYAFWFLPCWLPALLCKRMGIYPGYDSNIKMLAGLFTFALALWGGWKLAFWLWGSCLISWGALLGLVLCGYLTEQFMDLAQAWRNRQLARSFQKQHPMEWEKLKKDRVEIMQWLLGS